MRWLKCLVGVATAVIGLAGAASAQTGVVTGTVYRDSADHSLSDVVVSLMPIGVLTRTNYAGEFGLRGIPAGRYQLILRHVGFSVLTDSVVLADGQAIDREYVLASVPVTLDSVRVAGRAPQYRSPLLQEFEERMRAHLGGHFIGDSVLRRDEARKLQDLIISYAPGLRVFRPRSGAEYLTSTRGSARAFSGGGTCPVTLFVDGLPVFNPAVPTLANRGDEVPDLNRYSTADFSGIEFYPGGATIPPRFNQTGNNCGVLLLWTRDRVQRDK